ncbi:uridine/cytidine kinase [Acidipropionibacterium jensenii]|uniref:Uridine/cytidine kinase n=1 Tax=Acidipropionibacterium jensenii TaxID=1749 RepID=A0A3S4YQT7_9ACTN|nr:uridine kinase [Acidipropionibacterium jensenii]VEI04211.1 uridine/cytidine kinase [Acidipropionibacterium jensenii]
MASCTIVLLAGPSGSGKSRLARLTAVPQVRLDDFYRNGDDPDLPRVHGMVDWDDVDSWDMAAAVAALSRLVASGRAVTPHYVISENRTRGSQEICTAGSPAVLAEGIFATDLLAPCRAAGLAVLPIWLDRPRDLNFARRLGRDLRQHRKQPSILLRRGLALRQDERELRGRAVARGFQPMRMALARREIASLAPDTQIWAAPSLSNTRI